MVIDNKLLFCDYIFPLLFPSTPFFLSHFILTPRSKPPGGATRFAALNENVTHVIFDRQGESSRAENELFQLLEEKSLMPQVVSPEWLVECARQG